MQTVDEAVKFLKSTYGSLDSAAAMFNVDPVEVQQRLQSATKGTSEHYVLTLLAKNNPLPEVVKPKKKSKIVDVDLSLNDKKVEEAFEQVLVDSEDALRAIE